MPGIKQVLNIISNELEKYNENKQDYSHYVATQPLKTN